MLSKAIFTVLLLIGACATTSPYNGPEACPFISSTQFRKEVIADVNNPTNEELTLILDCTSSRHTLTIPAHTTQHVLLDRSDKECKLEWGEDIPIETLLQEAVNGT